MRSGRWREDNNGAVSQATASLTRGVGLMGVNAGAKGGLRFGALSARA